MKTPKVAPKGTKIPAAKAGTIAPPAKVTKKKAAKKKMKSMDDVKAFGKKKYGI